MSPSTIKDASGTITNDELQALLGAELDEDATVKPAAPGSGGDREVPKMPSKSRIATKHQIRRSHTADPEEEHPALI